MRCETAAINLGGGPPLSCDASAVGHHFDLLSAEVRRNPYPFYRNLRDKYPSLSSSARIGTP